MKISSDVWRIGSWRQSTEGGGSNGRRPHVGAPGSGFKGLAHAARLDARGGEQAHGIAGFDAFQDRKRPYVTELRQAGAHQRGPRRRYLAAFHATARRGARHGQLDSEAGERSPARDRSSRRKTTVISIRRRISLNKQIRARDRGAASCLRWRSSARWFRHSGEEYAYILDRHCGDSIPSCMRRSPCAEGGSIYFDLALAWGTPISPPDPGPCRVLSDRALGPGSQLMEAVTPRRQQQAAQAR